MGILRERNWEKQKEIERKGDKKSMTSKEEMNTHSRIALVERCANRSRELSYWTVQK